MQFDLLLGASSVSMPGEPAGPQWLEGEAFQCVGLLGGSCWTVAFSPDGRWLAAGRCNAVALYRTSDWQPVVLGLHGAMVSSLAFSSDGRFLASGSWDTTVKLWEVTSGRCLQTLPGHSEDVESVAFSPDGKLLASGSGDMTVKLWEVASGRCLQTLPGFVYVAPVAFSPDGKLLASGLEDSVRLWRMPSADQLNALLTGEREE